MPGHRFYQPDLASGHLSAEESHHAVHVLRLREGDSAALFDGRGTEVRVRLKSIDPDRVSFETLSTTKTPHPACRIRFGQALIKPAGMELLIQKLTELGVAEIWPIASERSVSKPEGEKESPPAGSPSPSPLASSPARTGFRKSPKLPPRHLFSGSRPRPADRPYHRLSPTGSPPPLHPGRRRQTSGFCLCF